jgi:hypothetical protein
VFKLTSFQETRGHIRDYDENTPTMKKKLLLCFIHGFKGDDNTFGEFPSHLQSLVARALPKIDVQAIVYPKFETRGDLGDCVARFRDWYVLLIDPDYPGKLLLTM